MYKIACSINTYLLLINYRMKRSRDDDKCVIHWPQSSGQTFIELTPVRLEKLLEIKKKHEAISSLSHQQQLKCISDGIPQVVSRGDGYHRDCYINFTKNVQRLPELEVDESPSKRARSSADSACKKEANCILCDNLKKRKGKNRSNSTFEHVSQLTPEQLNDIHYAAEKRNDIDIMLTLERFGIIRKKMMCHPSCRYSYINLSVHWRSSKEDQKQRQRSLEAAHNSAFDAVSSVIDQEIIRNHKIISLNDIKKIYVEALSCTDHKNEKYRSENLKSRLIKIYGKHIAFSAPVSKGRFQSSLVYSAAMDIDKAIFLAYQLGSTDGIRDTALKEREDIVVSHKKSPKMEWPITATELPPVEDLLPEGLTKFLRLLLTGKDKRGSDRAERHIYSIGDM